MLQETVADYIEDEALSRGAAIAYYTIFSIAPVLVICIAIAGLAFGEDAARGAMVGQLRGMMGDQAAEAVQAIVGFGLAISLLVGTFGRAGTHDAGAALLAVYWAVRLVSLMNDFPGGGPGGGFAAFTLVFAASPLVGLGMVVVGPGRRWFEGPTGP